MNELKNILSSYRLVCYVIARIKTHASVYQAHILPFELLGRDEATFGVVQMVLAAHEQAGHTVLMLKKDTKWHNQIIQGVCQPISEALDYDINAKINTLLQLSSTQVADQVAAWLTEIEQCAKATSVSPQEAKMLAQVVQMIFRFVWVYRHLSLDDFFERLMQCPFVKGQIKELTALEVSDAPIVCQRLPEGVGIWQNRTFWAEFQLVHHIKRLTSVVQSIDVMPTLSSYLNSQQHEAITRALASSFCIITGGPGTGKTFTVAQLVMALLSQADKPLQLALTAPTGKAAQRMQESLQLALVQADVQVNLPKAQTLHRLLGIGRQGVPAYHERNPLPFDMIIVDEASMLGVGLASALCRAIKTGARLILLGDVHQLAAVEAGAVLADLYQVPSLKPYRSQLIESRRFGAQSAIGKLAQCVKAATTQTEVDNAIELMHAASQLSYQRTFSHAPQTMYQAVIKAYQPYFKACHRIKPKLKGASQEAIHTLVASLMAQFNAYRVLTASHQGAMGDVAINEVVAAHYGTQITSAMTRQWYHGRAVMVTKNNYELGLFNGDVGICIEDGNGLCVYFEGKPVGIPVVMLPDEFVSSAYAITVHKSQGSEFEEVAVCFTIENARLLSKELIYTAITRAKQRVILYGDDDALALAMLQPTIRQTGLGALFDEVVSSGIS